MKKKSTVKTELIKVYRNHENAMSNFQRDVVNSVNEITFNNDLFGDPNESYHKLENTIINAKSNNFQPKYVPFKKYKHKLSPWMTAGILRSIKFLDNMYRKLIKTDSNASEYSALDNNLRIYKTILRKSIRLAKATYYANRLEQHKSDMRRTWSTINDILNKNRQRKVLPSYILVKAEKIVSPVAIANQFNNFFANNIGRNLSDKISRKSDKHVSTFLKQEVLSTFDFQCVDCIDVKKIIHTIAAKNSCGIDAISTKLIKMIGDDIAGPLTLIINQSLSTGVFPDKLKIAKVIPLYNRRPVGLSSFVNCPPVVASILTQRQLSVNAGWQHMGRVPHPNYVDPECCVATVCHQVRFIYWEHLNHFHRTISHLKWHKIVCMRYLACTFSQMKSTDMFSMYLQSGVPRHFIWWFIAGWT